MSRQLLTDEIIERYNQGEDLEVLLREYELRTGDTITFDDIDLEETAKSRRVESIKKDRLRRKLNIILVVILLLLALLVYAIFNW